jgi:pre-mRNA-processing factor 6
VLLSSARQQANTERVWMKSAILERQLGRNEEALGLLEQALHKFPHFPKLWLMKGQLLASTFLEKARETFTQGLKLNPKSISLWIEASRLEEKAGSFIKARATLEKARVLNPKIPQLWLEAIRVEIRGNNLPMAKALLAKSLQECPNSGLLWAESILMEPRTGRKSKSADALKKCENDPLVVLTIARLFWFERKLDKARNWFSRTVKTDSDLGDAFAWWLKFEMLHGSEEQRQDVIRKCIAAEPRHGEKWISFSKNIKHAGKSTEDILKMVAASLENAL